MAATLPAPRLSGLFRYPLKSAAALPAAEAPVESRGLAGDRRWLVCDANGRFITGRSHPRLSQIRAESGPDGLQLAAPGRTPIRVDPGRLERSWTVNVWKQPVQALAGDAEADAWLSAHLDSAVHLAYMPDSSHRPVDPRYAREGDQVSFADGFPLLLLGQASVDELNRRLVRPVTAMNFRPNLVIAGIPAHAEDGWQRVRIGEVEFEVVKACTRCIFVNVDPATAVPDPDGEPLRTLGSYRRTDQGIVFGQNLIPRSTGRLRLGDAVTVLG